MNYLLLPDMFAMSLLVGVLLALRRRRGERYSMRLWVAGLLLILLECAAHIVYTLRASSLLVHRVSHIVALESYLLAGILFLLSAPTALRAIPRRSVFVWGSALPLIILLALYAGDVRSRLPYSLCVVAGVVIGAILCVALRRTWRHMMTFLVLWSAPALAVMLDDFRSAAYSSLFLIYLMCAAAFRSSLPKSSRGGLAVVWGFGMWSLCFVTHPWLASQHPGLVPLATEVWNMQKFIITVGLLVVMLEEQMSGMEWASLHDHMTGLANRRGFDQQLRAAVARATRYGLNVTILTMDLDGFKSVNDTYGHEAGDVLLRQVAARLEDTARHIGTIARMGGDEFSLIAISPPAETDAEIARIEPLLLTAVELPVELGPAHGNHMVTISASIGSATCPPGTTDISQLMREADSSMYEEKTARSTRRHRRSAQHNAFSQQTA